MTGPLSSKRLCIIDGFDMVGKTTFIKNFMYDFKYYHPNHDITDQTVGRDSSWTIGYGIIDFFSQVGTENIKAVIDRGPASSFVYKELLTGIIDPEDDILKVIDWYGNSEFFKNEITHIHVCHYSRDSAREIYKMSQSRDVNPNVLSAKLDQFKDFDDYWETYKSAESLFSSVYTSLGILPIRVANYPGGCRVHHTNGIVESWKVGSSKC